MTVEQAKTILTDLAKMHAHFWNQPRLLELDWLNDNTTKRERTWGSMMKMIWNSKGKSRAAQSLTSTQVATIDMFVQKSASYARLMDSCDYTLCHGDLNTFNVLPEAAGCRTWTVDWQTVLRGNWSQDVAYFFLSHPVDDHEEALLEHYRNELVKNGVTMSHEQLASDFSAGNMFPLVYFCMSSGVLEPGNPADDEIWSFFVARIARILDKHHLSQVVENL